MLKKWKNIVIALAILAGTVGIGLTVVAPENAADAELHACRDDDGDGFGWDGEKTCDMNQSDFVDKRDSGFLGRKKYRTVTCFDSDGDGWGWAETHARGQRLTASCTGATHEFRLPGNW